MISSKIIVSIINISVLLTISFNYFLLFIGRLRYRKEWYLAAYSIFSFIISVLIIWMLIPEKAAIKRFAPLFEVLIITTVNISAFRFHAALIDYPKKYHRLDLTVIYIGMSIAVCLTIIAIISYNFYFKYFFIPVLVVIIPVTIFMILRQQVYFFRKLVKQVKSRKINKLDIVITIIELLSIIMVFLITRSLMFSNQNVSYFFLIINLMYSVLISVKLNMEKNQLEDLKNTLEDKVKERTTELEQANREIARHSEARAEFFINLAHEVRTPLTVVKSAFDIFTQRHGHFKEIGTIRRNLDKLIRDMINFLDHEKLEQDRIFYNHSTACNVSRKVNRMVNLFNDMASVKNIMLHKSIAPGLHVMIDPDALERILYNLLDNALKYTQTGTITTTMTGDESHVYLEVTDTGIGIPADEIPNIFTSFYQITRKKRNNQGMGMGLVIVKKILDDVGGEISAKSTAGKGTTFTVTFVRSRSEDVECSGENPDSDEPFIEVVRQGVDDVISDKNVRSLFIVEDNPELLNYLAQHLRDEYNLYFALDGKEALKRIKSIPRPDAIISDIMMDNMNGYVLKDKLDEIQEYRTIPFMYMTAKTLKDDMIAGYQKGAVAYLKKPFSVDELKAKLTALITFRNSNTNGILEKSQKERRDKIEQYLIKKKIANRERELIYHVAEGKTNKEIGDLMNLTEGSVKAYLSRIYKKLKVNRNELTYLINSKELSGKNNSG